MKKIIKTGIFALLISAFVLSVGFTKKTAYAKENDENRLFENKSYKSCYLMDFNSGNEMYKDNELEHLPIASMCKIMTLLVCFDEINSKRLSLDEEIKISQNASSMGGSQVFLEANGIYKVDNLLKSIVVCSANDSCVAMAERVAGSECSFVDMMNEKAKSIGANDTCFTNCTGLPKGNQYSCAKDVALMFKHLLNNKHYFDYSKVWLENFEHPQGRVTEMTNTNKLIRFYDGCDGGKTGFTNQAGFCLACTAKRGNMRSIAVVIGSPSSDERFKAIRTLLDYSFANFTTKQVLDVNEQINEICNVKGGKEKEVKLKPSTNAYVFLSKKEEENINIEYDVFSNVKAPVKQGDVLGKANIFKDNVLYTSVDLVSTSNVEKMSLWDSIKEIVENWSF